MSSAWEQTKVVVVSEKFRLIMAGVLALSALYIVLAYVGYLFTGSYDVSLLQSEMASAELKSQIKNIMGPMGARIAHWMIDGTFGVASIALPVMMVCYAIGLSGWRTVRPWRIFFCSIFWMLWGSVFCAYIQLVTSMPLFFRLGGTHGEWIASYLLLNMRWIGVLLLLTGILLIFGIIVSDQTIPTLKRFGQWCLSLVPHKPKPVQESSVLDDTSAETPADVPEVEIVLEDTPEKAPEIDLGDVLDITPAANEPAPADMPELVIEAQDSEAQASESQDSESQDTPEIPNTPETPAEAPLEIDKPVENEILENDPEYILKTQGPYDPRAELSHYKFPSLDLLKVYDNENAPIIDPEEQKANAARIVNTLKNYGVEIDSIKATVGPTVTLYEVVPKAGVRISKIQSLESDIMLSLSAKGIRIIAPMPGKGTVGIEVPNVNPQTVSMHSVIASKRFQEDKKMKLPIALGRTITNDIFMFDLAKTPHLLVAGATGQGKSVAINAIITSLLYKKHPAEMKMVLVDPKMVEFAPYKPLLKHYLAAMPDVDENDVIITDCSKVVDTLNSLVIEMENRYKLLMDAGVRNLEEYNDKFISRRLNPAKVVADSLHHQYLPYMVIVIDEYGDFIMQAGKQVETPIARITQKARAVGMHMILATQRPSVNIVTGVIKANIPTRIALRTQSVVDSRTVLDAKGADQLIGRGDLLYSGSGEITRIQCAFVDTPEVDAVVEHVHGQQSFFGPYELPEYVSGEGGGEGEALAPGAVDLKRLDPMFRDIATYVVHNQQGSTSVLQRKFQIGYNRAGKISDQLEAAGVVGPNKGPKGRDVLIQDDMALQNLFQELGL